MFASLFAVCSVLFPFVVVFGPFVRSRVRLVRCALFLFALPLPASLRVARLWLLWGAWFSRGCPRVPACGPGLWLPRWVLPVPVSPGSAALVRARFGRVRFALRVVRLLVCAVPPSAWSRRFPR